MDACVYTPSCIKHMDKTVDHMNHINRASLEFESMCEDSVSIKKTNIAPRNYAINHKKQGSGLPFPEFFVEALAGQPCVFLSTGTQTFLQWPHVHRKNLHPDCSKWPKNCFRETYRWLCSEFWPVKWFVHTYMNIVDIFICTWSSYENGDMFHMNWCFHDAGFHKTP